MRGTVHKKTKIKCKAAQRAPVPTIQKSKAEVEFTIFGFVCFFYSSGEPHIQHSYRPLWGKAASQQLDTQKLLRSNENN